MTRDILPSDVEPLAQLNDAFISRKFWCGCWAVGLIFLAVVGWFGYLIGSAVSGW